MGTGNAGPRRPGRTLLGRALALTIVVAFLLASLAVLAATETTLSVVNVRPLSSGLANELRPSIHGSMLAFLGTQDTTRVVGDVYVVNLDTNALSRITTNGTVGAQPDIYGGNVVWLWYDGNLSHPFISDIAEPSPTQLSHDSLRVGQVRIDGERVVWTEDRPHPGSPFVWNTISLYNLTTGEVSQLVSEESSHGDLAIEGDRVVWGAITRTSWEYYPPPTDLYMMSLSSHTLDRLTDDGFSSSPSVFGDLVVYTNWDLASHDFELMLYDASNRQTRQLTVNGYPDFGGAVFGRRIAWQAAAPNARTQVFLTDLALGITIAVTPESRSAGRIALSNRFLVWEDSDGTGRSGVRIMVGEIVVEHFALWYVSFALATSAASIAFLSLWRSIGRSRTQWRVPDR